MADLVYGMDSSNVRRALRTDTSGKLQIADVTLTVGDIQLGSVEIKNDGTDDRAKVINTTPAGTEMGLVVRPAGPTPAGTNNIGDVDVLTLPALVAGAAKIGAVDLDSDATTGSAVPAVAQLVAGTDGTNARALKTDTNGELQVDVLTMPTITVDSEFPAAGALADAAANPTTTSVAALDHVFNGTTWDRARGDTTNGLDVDVTRLPALVAGTANIGDVDVLTLPALVTGSATIGAVTGPTADNAANPTLKLGTLPAVALAAAPTRTEGNVNPLRLNLAGDVAVTLDSEAVVLGAGTAEIGKLAAGTANIGDVDVLTLPALVAGAAKIGAVDLDSDATTGAAVPAVAQLVAGTDGTNARALKTDTSGELQVDVLTLPALVAGAAKIGAVDLDSDATTGSAVPAVAQLAAGTDGTNARALKTDTAGELQVDVLTLPTVDTELPAAAALADATANPTVPGVGNFAHLFNSSTWDRVRNNHEVTALSSAARTGDTNSTDQINYNAKGMAILLDVTAVGSPAGQIDAIRVQAKIGSSYLTVLAFATLAIASTGVRAFLIYPGAASAGSWTAAPLQGAVPRNWRIQVDHANETDSITYSVVASYIN